MKRTTIIEIIVMLYVILFLYTGISKIMEYGVFKEQLAESPILAPMASLVARGLPIVEFLLVVLLAVPRWRLKGFYASTGLMIAFTIYIIVLMSFNDQLPCSCGGVLAALSWGQHIVFNGVFIVLGIVGVILERKVRRTAADYWHAIVKQPDHSI
ncbi:hypothetical protein HB364_12110 [Pseudoflavitalea sp. X16]|uniref:MauE/DoxX family redox-associated membrane protein n=1 Tax=Paraflavitalea devenefica TaxID=2716334 RepID=UPI0014240379|nr:MauE/DoxX family redox-associated membrane protein [Paraflavitalea devenefica]NII25833.1 hypothetical protein [Paraflavitalea devenefica]